MVIISNLLSLFQGQVTLRFVSLILHCSLFWLPRFRVLPLLLFTHEDLWWLMMMNVYFELFS
ncbi:hypothetical protein CY34DRAFT_477447 [Suillus luteus UH-Slu-Lm8-n1]|uniref:Uncharacterized protein n=1 Tax=Suillus luteus UH-Slu-Lm8-n1 TaxID=930992 RepID=A0A0D0AG34_9AGAM|nr:hypothetical protein CY34DRAFT_477447 [Suillus luteus UH-Slu-Lm8-n1]